MPWTKGYIPREYLLFRNEKSMMEARDISRISRLTAIVMQLQAKRLVTSTDLAIRFSVSKRTIYRDIRTLEQAGIPILTEEGKGYSLMDGYRLPPVSFTEGEANALITAEQLLLNNRDASFKQEYASAVQKIRAVLQYNTKEKAAMLSDRIAISPILLTDQSSNSLSLIQRALTSYRVLDIVYHSAESDSGTARQVEPFALYFSLEGYWLLIAYCRLRQDFRMFRLDRITSVRMLETSFEPHRLTLGEYLSGKRKKFTTPDIPLSQPS